MQLINAPSTPLGAGDLPIRVPNGQSFSTSPSGTYCTPQTLVQTLVSVGLIDNAGYTVTFANGTCTIHDTAHKTIGLFPKRGGLYKVDTHLRDSTSASSSHTSLSIEDAHQLLSHISPDAVNSSARTDSSTGSPSTTTLKSQCATPEPMPN